jgi:hypothetical protein
LTLPSPQARTNVVGLTTVLLKQSVMPAVLVAEVAAVVAEVAAVVAEVAAVVAGVVVAEVAAVLAGVPTVPEVVPILVALLDGEPQAALVRPRPTSAATDKPNIIPLDLALCIDN